VTCLTLAQTAATDGTPYLLWGFILAGAALGLLLVEILVPSGGLLGVLCGVAGIGSIVAFFQYDPKAGVAALVAYAIATPVLLVLFFKLWLNSPLARRMVLGGEKDLAPSDEDDAARATEQARAKRLEQTRQLIGADGITETALRPVGFVKINGQRLDAMAESGIIEANTPVVVTDVYDNQIKVRPKA
jgi:membrane-bound ClpP family serine protease